MPLVFDPANATEVGAAITALDTKVSTLMASTADLQSAVDHAWIFWAGSLVFFMQAGFALVEAGSVRVKNTQNILFKNFMDACIGTVCFWLIGFGLAYGDGNDSGFIGGSNFGLSLEGTKDGHGYISFFFQWAFAATTATIVSGSVAERTKPAAYFIYVICITAIIYPIVAHWVWDGEGFLSAFNTESPIFGVGMIDFAGSGVVHTVGGLAGLVGAYVAKPRIGRFDEQGQKAKDITGHNMMYCGLGTFILWFGWYGFNCGSTLAIQGGAYSVAAHVAVTTTISAVCAGLSAVMSNKMVGGFYDLSSLFNGILGGLVSITAGCPVVEPWAAAVIGLIGGLVYRFSARLVAKLRIDDPLEASAVHGFCGVWGVVAAALFADEGLATAAAYNTGDGWYANQLAANCVGILIIVAWTLATCGVLFMTIEKTVGMRVSKDMEINGLDKAEHGRRVYRQDSIFSTPKHNGHAKDFAEMATLTVLAEGEATA